MRPRVWLGVKHILTNGGECKGWSPNDSQVHSHFGSCKCLEPWLKRNISTKLGPHDTIKKVLKRRCLKCPYIVHLDMICISYDQKNGHESNWEFDSRPQTPWNKGSNEVRIKCVIHHWKDISKGYKILSSHFQNKLDLRKIWTSKVLRQQES
jgi:hypothetical protein